MRPLFTVGVWLVAACHFAFLLYLVGGGFLAVALRRAGRLSWSRRALLVHAAVVAWALASVAVDLWCPLTSLERWLRPRAGLAPLPQSGFIDHYLAGVLFPAGAGGYATAAAFLAVAVSWTAYSVLSRRTGAEWTAKSVS